MQIAPLSLRLMAAVVNGSLVMGVFLAAAMVVASRMKELPSLREAEVGSAVALAVIAALYHGALLCLCQGHAGDAVRRGLSLHFRRMKSDTRPAFRTAGGDAGFCRAYGAWRHVGDL